jgi:hypothetical protein
MWKYGLSLSISRKLMNQNFGAKGFFKISLGILSVFAIMGFSHGQGIDSAVVVSEIHYHPVAQGDAEWVELHCISGVNVDLSGWSLGGGIHYQFPEGTVITGRGYLVVSANQGATSLAGVTSLAPFTGQLSNSGDEIQVINRTGRIMDDVQYSDDGNGWPDAADGSGATLSKRDVNSADPTAANWTGSVSTGGTPGRANFSSPAQQPDANPTIVLNEISAGGSGFKLELANLTNASIDLTGMIIKSSAGVSYTLPAQSLGANGFLALTAATLGFTPVSGDKLFLFKANGTDVLDSRKVTGKLRGRSLGRWLFPSSATFGSANAFSFNTAIVINEIMYHPRPLSQSPFTQSTEQWVELYNRSAGSVDLSNWKLAGGISFKFPSGTSIPAGGYLVVSNNFSALQLKWPAVASKIIGNFTGKISHKGDQVELDDASNNPVNTVTFSDGGRWAEVADGGGPSLELRDPRADNSTPEAWGASNESARGSWQTFTWQGTATNLNGDPTQWNEFIFGLLDAGTYLVDDVSVIEDNSGSSRQVIQSGDFESGLGTWRCLGTQGHASIINDPSGSGKVLQVISTGGTEHMHNHVETTLKSAGSYVAINGALTYHVSFRARWVSGSNLLNTRLYFNRLAQTVTLPVADGGGTPGASNSDAVANLGPTYTTLTHSPAVPAAGQPATVSVAASDPDNIASLTLFYSINGGGFSSTAMTLQNGTYSGAIPGQSSGTKVRFYVQATDVLGASSFFPGGGPNSHAIIPWNDGQALLSVNGVNPTNLRIVMTPVDTTTLYTTTNVMSNDPIGCTVILDESTIFYDCGIHMKGSERGRDQDTRVSFVLSFPSSQKLYGAHKSAGIDRSGGGNVTSQKEILIKHGITHAGNIPGGESDLCHVIAPLSKHTGPAILTKEEYDSAYLDNQYASGSDGRMFKYELIYYPLTTSGGGVENLKLPEPDNVVGVGVNGLGTGKELYRWHWLIENNQDADDYSGLITVLNAFGRGADAQYFTDTTNFLDVTEWLRCYAVENLFGIGDNYGGDGSQHNLILYNRPSDGRWLFMPHDMDFMFNNSSTGGLVNNSDLNKLLGKPANARLYYGYLRELCFSTYNTAYLQPWAVHYSKFLNEDLTQTMSYVSTRNSTVLNAVNSAIPPVSFNITTANNTSFPGSFATITGTGWIDINSFQLVGAADPLTATWTSTTAWQIQLPIVQGSNSFTINAYDSQGALIGSKTVTVIGTGPLVPAAAGNLVISELMYHPTDPTSAESTAGYASSDDFEFIELQNISSSTLDLTGVAFTVGIDYAFPSGTQLAPGGRLIVTNNRSGFLSRYGNSLPVATGQYGPTTKLSNSGEEVVLTDAAGRDIVRFTYSDTAPWPADADGLGYSLVLINSTGNPDPTVVANWRLSVGLGGNPGTTDATHFTGNPTGDDDHNGISNFTQYTLAGSAPYIGPQTLISGGNLVYQYHINLAADDVIRNVQTSTDLVNWTVLPGTYAVTSQAATGNGTAGITLTGPAVTEARRFFRLVLTPRP